MSESQGEDCSADPGCQPGRLGGRDVQGGLSESELIPVVGAGEGTDERSVRE